MQKNPQLKQQKQEESKQQKKPTRMEEDYPIMHGHLGQPLWKAPLYATYSEEENRPGYKSYTRSEFQDDPQVLNEKIDMLVKLIKKSKNMVAYTGAGISVAAGLGDYATKQGNTITGKVKVESINRLQAQPTKSHFVLTSLYKAGFLKHWVQQNHDRLAQKSGYPQEKLNEIHGSWFDKKNPVVLMDDSLKKENLKWLLEWEQKTDLCLALGSSLCGMNADRIADTPAQKFLESFKNFSQNEKKVLKANKKDDIQQQENQLSDEQKQQQQQQQELQQNQQQQFEENKENQYKKLHENLIDNPNFNQLGLVIINLQRTQYDNIATLRIYAKLDDALSLLAQKLQLKIQQQSIKTNKF